MDSCRGVSRSAEILAGTDEAGRGPLAGPVVAAAVILNRVQEAALVGLGLRDSKKLSPFRREELFAEMLRLGVLWAAQAAGVSRILKQNISGASLWAMGRSVLRLPVKPELLVVDGLQKIPGLPIEQMPLVKADDRVPAVSAASVIAKVLRDRVMTALDRLYPLYGFAVHKGYPTKAHREAVRVHGLSPVHRELFCRKLLRERTERL